MLPEEINKKVINMTANDRTLLAEYGGTIKLGWKWCTSVFKRMKWTNRRGGTTAKPAIAQGLIKEVGLTFFKNIAELVQANKIPPELIINCDQTPLPFILVSKYSMHDKKVPRMYRFRASMTTVKLPGHSQSQ